MQKGSMDKAEDDQQLGGWTKRSSHWTRGESLACKTGDFPIIKSINYLDAKFSKSWNGSGSRSLRRTSKNAAQKARGLNVPEAENHARGTKWNLAGISFSAELAIMIVCLDSDACSSYSTKWYDRGPMMANDSHSPEKFRGRAPMGRSIWSEKARGWHPGSSIPWWISWKSEQHFM